MLDLDFCWGTLPGLFHSCSVDLKQYNLLLHMNPNPDCEDWFCSKEGV
jgi:hypothetical protein